MTCKVECLASFCSAIEEVMRDCLLDLSFVNCELKVLVLLVMDSKAEKLGPEECD